MTIRSPLTTSSCCQTTVGHCCQSMITKPCRQHPCRDARFRSGLLGFVSSRHPATAKPACELSDRYAEPVAEKDVGHSDAGTSLALNHTAIDERVKCPLDCGVGPEAVTAAKVL